MPKTKTKTKERTQDFYRKILTIYAEEGATPAAKAAKVSKRTVQRWASKAGVQSGYKAPIRVEGPSPAAYARGERDPKTIAAYRESNQKAKARRLRRFRKGESQPDCGKASTYSNYDCRGAACRAAWSKYLRDKRHAEKAGEDPSEISSNEQILCDGEGCALGCPQGLNPLED